LAEAFLLSIDHFNKGQMKYTWPYFLPSTPTAACSFFDPAVKSILTQLRESRVLESCAGTMVKASSLKHVPLDLFADREGIPFTMNQHTAASYLSLKYPEWVIEATSSIGVTKLSPREFLEDLNSAIAQDPTAFRTRSPTWHSQLGETLIKLATEPELESLILDMCLIPLHDDNWASARGQSMFFSKDENSLEIPSGIEVLILDPTAESDPVRRKLFTSLGVKAWEASEICSLVLKVHQSSNFDPTTLTRDQLISHAVFLYKASWQPPQAADLWFATMQDERCLGGKLYIPWCNETNSAAAKIFTQLQKQFAVIHNDYLKVFPLDPNWPIWLVNNLGLSMVPRLITPHIDPQPQPTQISDMHENAIVDGGFDTNLSGNQNATDVLDDFDFDSFSAKDVTEADFNFFDSNGADMPSSFNTLPAHTDHTAGMGMMQQRRAMPAGQSEYADAIQTGHAALQDGQRRPMMPEQKEKEQQTPSKGMVPPTLMTQARIQQIWLAQKQGGQQATFAQLTQPGTRKAHKPKGEFPAMFLLLRCD
jgi:hypothetical protein